VKILSKKFEIIRFLSITMIIMGALLITYMIIFEGELGAIPLFLTVAGILWFVINEIRVNKHIQKQKSNDGDIL
jgi:hypothetical protein